MLHQFVDGMSGHQRETDKTIFFRNSWGNYRVMKTLRRVVFWCGFSALISSLTKRGMIGDSDFPSVEAAHRKVSSRKGYFPQYVQYLGPF
jgi:hypothetical protein